MKKFKSLNNGYIINNIKVKFDNNSSEHNAYSFTIRTRLKILFSLAKNR